MFGREKIIPWDLGIIWNEIFSKGVEKFGSLQSRKWDRGILLSYLNWFHNFVETSGDCINDYNQSGGTEAWRTNFAALWSASA